MLGVRTPVLAGLAVVCVLIALAASGGVGAAGDGPAPSAGDPVDAVPADAPDRPADLALEPGEPALPPGENAGVTPLLVPDPASYQAQKDQADRQTPPEDRPVGSAAAKRQLIAPSATTLLNRPGLAAHADRDGNFQVPPDSTGAIGPRDYIEAVNSEIAMYRRGNLRRVGRLSLNRFVGARVSDDVFDPQIQWDPVASRWFYLAVRSRRSRNYLVYGWSKTASPRSLRRGWCRFKTFSGEGRRRRLLDDYPKLGTNDNHITFGTNVFSSRRGRFQSARIYAVSKPPPGDASCARPTVRRFGSPTAPLRTADGDRAFTPVPAQTIDGSPNGYVVAADTTPGRQIMVWHIAGPPSAPTLVPDGNIEVPAYHVPPNIPQPRTSRRLDSLDGRLTQAVAAVNPLAANQLTLWTQHTIRGSDRRSAARWYELVPGTRAIHQVGTVAVGGRYVFNAAISPSGGPAPSDDAAMNYNVAGRRARVQIRARSQEDFQTPNQLVGEVTLGGSRSVDRSYDCFARGSRGVCRWGDYAGASPDPSQADRVWGSNQTLGRVSRRRCDRRGRPCPYWRTRNFELQTGP